MSPKSFLKAGHTPTLFAAFLYFDLSFMVWVILGPLGVAIAKSFHLDPAQKGLMVATPVLAGALLRSSGLEEAVQVQVHRALMSKDATELASLTASCVPAVTAGLQALLTLYGDTGVLQKARACLPDLPQVSEALSQLEWLVQHIRAAFEDVTISLDLADLPGYAYYTGMRFSVYAAATNEALARGGRYDEVGSVFGRKRPAVGFSVDIKALVMAAQVRVRRAAIRAPWAEDQQLARHIAQLRRDGETVVCVLPGHESEVDEFDCDRELRQVAGAWTVTAI